MARSNSRVLLRAAFLIVIITMVLMIIARFQDLNGAEKISPTPAPEFTQTDPAAWINSKPLRINELKGKVTLIDIWTFECWNCYRSFPWLKKIEQKFAHDLQIVGIHTPEFAREKIRSNIVSKTKEFGLTHPVMMDNNFAYWKLLKNRYWPAFYVIDKKGIIRGRFIGETHAGDRNANGVEKLIKQLIKEK
jgi:thiol-disulfide isomerase/thioredoxin